MSSARTLLGLTSKGRALRAARALGSRVTHETSPDELWPIGEIKMLGGDAPCHHVWGEHQIIGDVILQGCCMCPAVVRLAPAPLDDPSELERWLDS